MLFIQNENAALVGFDVSHEFSNEIFTHGFDFRMGTHYLAKHGQSLVGPAPVSFGIRISLEFSEDVAER